MSRLFHKMANFAHARWNKGLPSSLIFFITNMCNLKCEHCFYWEELNNSVKDLTLDELRKVSRHIGWLNNLLVTGGEPFLRKDLAEVLDVFVSNNKLQFALIPTNGFYRERTLTTLEKIKNLCPTLNVTLQISLDGTRVIHDQIRGVQGSYDNAIDTLDVLVNYTKGYPRLDVVTNTVVNNKNYDDALELYRFLKSRFKIHAGLSIYRGGGFGDHLTPPSREQWQNIIAILREQDREEITPENRFTRTVHRFRTEYLHYLNVQAIEGNISPFNCSAGDIIGVLDHNGDVKVCENHKPFGNVRDFDYDFAALWRSQQARAMRQIVKRCFCNHPCFLQSGTSYYFSNHVTIASYAVHQALGLPFHKGTKTHFLDIQKSASLSSQLSVPLVETKR